MDKPLIPGWNISDSRMDTTGRIEWQKEMRIRQEDDLT
jgi:hypothetical protein